MRIEPPGYQFIFVTVYYGYNGPLGLFIEYEWCFNAFNGHPTN